MVSGKVAGYGGRETAGSLGEYASRSGANYSANRDFPVADFVGSMPGPSLGGGAVVAPSVSHPEIGLPGPASHHSGSTSHTGHRAGLRDPSAILNPFTHQIGPSITMPGVGSVAGSGLGPSH